MARTTARRQSAATGQVALEIPAPARVRPADREKLTLRYEAAAPVVTVAAPPADDGLPPTRSTYHQERATAEPFGAWLLKQKGRGGLIGDLATAARIDRGFTKAITPDQLRARLVEQSADGDMHAALDYAEIDWIAL